MSMESSGKRSRSRRNERSQQLYEARALPGKAERPAFAKDGGFEKAPPISNVAPSPEADWVENELPTEEYSGWEGAYASNEPGDPSADRAYEGEEEPSDASGWEGAYASNEPGDPSADRAYKGTEEPPHASGWEENAPADQTWNVGEGVNPQESAAGNNAAPPSEWAAYFRRPSGEDSAQDSSGENQFAYAPPVKLGYTSMIHAEEPAAGKSFTQPDEGSGLGAMNVYRPREAGWAQTDRQKAVEIARSRGYQIQEEGEEPALRRRKRKRRLRTAVTLTVVAGVLAGGAYLLRKPLLEWIGSLTGIPVETASVYTAVVTPAPVRGYDPASPVKVADKTADAITRISGTVTMETRAVTDTSVLTRSARADGKWDYYLFGASDGKLLAYYEALGGEDVSPLPGGGYYLRQAPWLLSEEGKAMLRTADLERILGEPAVLHPLMNGWAVISNAASTRNNYVNLEGQLISQLWFVKAYPMTGAHTLAYVDTGNPADLKERYALYLLDREGNAQRWKEAGDMSDVVASACDAAYFNNGELYSLSQPETPLTTTSEARFYLDCDAIVVKDSQTGKYGLYVHGEQHYDSDYDVIEPVESDMRWTTLRYEGQQGAATLSYVTGANYPQPRSHYFLLKKGDVVEYVALSTSSACPIILD